MNKTLEKLLGLFRNFSAPSPTIPFNSSLGAFVSISLTSKGILQKGYGVVMTLTNVENNDSFTTNSLGSLSPHSIIENIPEGKYYVSKIEIPLADLIYINQSQELREFFGELEFRKSFAYYLGDFIGTRKVGRDNVFHLKIENQNIPEKLIKKLTSKGIVLSEQAFIKTYPYTKDELTIY